MAFTKVWAEDVPGANDDLILGDDAIRDTRFALRERLAIDHNFKADESGDDFIGRHNKCSFIEQVDLGTGAEGKPILGAQIVGGKAELVYTDEDDGDVELTHKGFLGSGSGCLVYLTSTDQTIPSGVATKVLFNSESYDVLSEYDNSSNYRFMVNSSGKYLITTTVFWAGAVRPPDQTLLTLSIYKNGSVLFNKIEATASASFHAMNLSMIANLTANDYIEIFVTQGSGVNLYLDSSGIPYTCMAAQRIS